MSLKITTFKTDPQKYQLTTTSPRTVEEKAEKKQEAEWFNTPQGEEIHQQGYNYNKKILFEMMGY